MLKTPNASTLFDYPLVLSCTGKSGWFWSPQASRGNGDSNDHKSARNIWVHRPRVLQDKSSHHKKRCLWVSFVSWWLFLQLSQKENCIIPTVLDMFFFFYNWIYFLGGVGDMQFRSGVVAIDDGKESCSPSSPRARGVHAHHAMGIHLHFPINDFKVLVLAN